VVKKTFKPKSMVKDNLEGNTSRYFHITGSHFYYSCTVQKSYQNFVTNRQNHHNDMVLRHISLLLNMIFYYDWVIQEMKITYEQMQIISTHYSFNYMKLPFI